LKNLKSIIDFNITVLCTSFGFIKCRVKDKFGVSWQVVPSVLRKMLNEPDPVKSKRVMDTMLRMNKIIIKDLEKAYNQKL